MDVRIWPDVTKTEPKGSVVGCKKSCEAQGASLPEKVWSIICIRVTGRSNQNVTLPELGEARRRSVKIY